MSYFKRFLLLLSLGVFLLAGLMFISNTRGSSTAFASGCNTVATNNWKYNCQVSEGNISNFVSAIQETVDGAIGGTYNHKTDNCSEITVDGNFGPDTLAAVKCFQGFMGLSQDGIVGQQTWEAMYNTLIPSYSDSGWHYYYTLAGANATFRQWINSGIWYVYVYTTSKGFHWCQVNLSSPC